FFPSALYPSVNPVLLEGINDQCAIAVDMYDARFSQGFQGLNDGPHLHTVVGGIMGSAGYFPLFAVPLQQRAPAARPRISAAGAVGKYNHCFLIRHTAR